MGNGRNDSPYPLGAHKDKDGVRFSYVSKKKDCGIILYDRKTGRQKKKLPFLPEEKQGNIYSKKLTMQDADCVTYLFYEEEKKLPDPCGKAFCGNYEYGKKCKEEDLRAYIIEDTFDWQSDKNPRIPYQDSICYCLHVRGFTAHPSSGVQYRGTFAGLREKIPYLKECGITTVELQPVYEFLELAEQDKTTKPYHMPQEEKLNYWGYTRGYYYAPKAAYSASVDAVTEFKEMVKAFHENNMELILQFYFPNEVKSLEIPDILRYWVLNYHVDGFHLMGEKVPANMLAQDPLLADTKLWYHGFDTEMIYERDEMPDYGNLAVYQDNYLFDMRRFLKGDEGMLNAVLYHMRTIPQKMGRIHFFSNYYGFTLADMVAYDRKHNEDNGENNRDGCDYNCSWNCGDEGSSRKKKVQKLRLQQLKNALTMLFFSHSTPLIFMGDEFGNSQKGNNNPYCLDNEITWINWKDLDKNKELHSFFKRLVQLRKEHPVLRKEREPKLMDYISCGYPDLSYHGESAWQPQLEVYQRSVGILYSGCYGKHRNGEDDNFFYLGINMHWEPCELALPRLPKGLKWHCELITCEEGTVITDKEELAKVDARSIVLFISVPDAKTIKGTKNQIKSMDRQPF